MINILSSNNYTYLKENILKKSSIFNEVFVETKTFPDGEHYWKIENPTKIQGKPAVYICGTTDDMAIFDAYNISCTLVREGCSELHLVIPYFGYSTMERAVMQGDAVTAKNIARMFSSLPTSSQGNHIYMMDLHSLGIQYYFEGNMHPVHLSSWSVIKDIISDLGSNSVLASTDMGRAKWIEKMGNELHMETAYIMKKRVSGSQTEIIALNAEVKGRDVIIFDDMIRSGSSIIKAAEAYKNSGAEDIHVVCVHGVFVNDAIQKFKNSGIIKSVSCTNTHPNALINRDNFCKLYDISSVILKGLNIVAK